MPDQLLKPKIKWPRWVWRDSAWWLTVFGTVFAVIVYVQPSVSSHSFWVRVSIALGVFVLSSILLLAMEHLVKACSVAFRRIRAYEGLHEIAEQQIQHNAKAQEVILKLLQELTAGRKFEIEKTLYYNETLYISIRKKRGARLQEGDMVTVINAQDGGIMGMFEVSEVRSDEYRARVADYIDPVWLGFVHQDGRAETSAPPNAAAFFMPKD